MPPSSSNSDRHHVVPPDEAFAALGNETRVDILLALWDAFESAADGNGLSYSKLYDAVDIADSGNFSYHLEKVTGPFVRRTDAGEYELKQTGINVVRSVIEGSVSDDTALAPRPIDVECPICGGAVELSYADGLLSVSCTECEGRIPWNDETGHLFGAPVPPVALEDRPPEETLRAGTVFALHKVATFLEGVCSDCSRPVETALSICSEHDLAEGTRCPVCERFNLAEAWLSCSTCKLRIFLPVALAALHTPHATAFFHESGLEHRFANWETVVRSFQVDEELRSVDPQHVRITIAEGTERLALTMDEDLDVVEMST